MGSPERRMAGLIDDLEREMRALGQWADTPPSAAALSSTMPFCYDTLGFSEWLQWVFVARVRELLDRRQALPMGSDILPLAEVWFEELGMTRSAAEALRIIREIDDCLNQGGGPRLH